MSAIQRKCDRKRDRAWLQVVRGGRGKAPGDRGVIRAGDTEDVAWNLKMQPREWNNSIKKAGSWVRIRATEAGCLCKRAT